MFFTSEAPFLKNFAKTHLYADFFYLVAIKINNLRLNVIILDIPYEFTKNLNM